ncbi:MAG: histidinol dehydrogenase [Actinobacteria bacterium]|nr:histidinol dehydrogenase [Actinomycetota bacterium]MCL6105498.1 histidinol dehydrogenase [Actinomycetota bacterium]
MSDWNALLPSSPILPQDGSGSIFDVVKQIVGEVKNRGDGALSEFSRLFDGVELTFDNENAAAGVRSGAVSIKVSRAEMEDSFDSISTETKQALYDAYAKIWDYHRFRMPSAGDTYSKDILRGGKIEVSELLLPLRRAGLYAPGGNASYPSSVFMCAIPPKVAGVEEIALCTPPGPNGKVADVTLAACVIAGVDEVYRIGGAHAIAAMAYGTETISAVDTIVGPGNNYVVLAKLLVSEVVGTPGAYAGPSEVVVVADSSAPASFVAIDLIVQAEHGPNGLAWLVCWEPDIATQVNREVDRYLNRSSRKQILESTLGSNGYAVLVDGEAEAACVVNTVAPEHLELMVASPSSLLGSIKNAGVIFLGPYSPASLGDYVAGPNHVLPTARTARFQSALSAGDFLRRINVISADREGLAQVSDVIKTLAEAEGLQAHGEAIKERFLK